MVKLRDVNPAYWSRLMAGEYKRGKKQRELFGSVWYRDKERYSNKAVHDNVDDLLRKFEQAILDFLSDEKVRAELLQKIEDREPAEPASQPETSPPPTPVDPEPSQPQPIRPNQRAFQPCRRLLALAAALTAGAALVTSLTQISNRSLGTRLSYIAGSLTPTNTPFADEFDVLQWKLWNHGSYRAIFAPASEPTAPVVLTGLLTLDGPPPDQQCPEMTIAWSIEDGRGVQVEHGQLHAGEPNRLLHVPISPGTNSIALVWRVDMSTNDQCHDQAGLSWFNPRLLAPDEASAT
ncbi:hypothetical protein AMK34_10405 [Amycolatopsis sp. CB00013]|nr:hypothetical protein AMK34_10405 [Amycolatopsis sp. CB00013]